MKQSKMYEEIRSIPAVLRKQMARDEELYSEIGSNLRAHPPAFAATLARGSSDSVAAYIAYILSRDTGVVTSSVSPSLITHCGSSLKMNGALVLGISQSGQSPDITEPMQQFKNNGAMTVSIVNMEGSPLADISEWSIPAHAGEEKSVAATKSYIACALSGLRMVGHWSENNDILKKIPHLPERIEEAVADKTDSLIDVFTNANSVFVVGRGPGLAAAQEVALKFKETCLIHAEAFSSAEIKHGPFALIGGGATVLVLAPDGPFKSELIERAIEMKKLGARVIVLGSSGTIDGENDVAANMPKPLHPDLDILVAICFCYSLIEQVSIRRGFDPDVPRNLNKITITR